ncbi:MAG: ABC transporter permease [Dehalococcoidia bacterium]|nr:ABC transporter permease [Dehalococcoidia bacterium]
MAKQISDFFYDSKVMFKRCMKIALRNPEALVQATITPIFLMLMFGAVFGNIADVGAYNYVDYILPGIILQAVAQATQYTAINVNADMTKGIIDRFRSMPLAKSALLIGHAGASVVRNVMTTVVIIGTAFIVGFRPQAGFVDWLVIIGVLLLSVTAITCFAVFCGLRAKSPEGASGLMFPLFILPFISSGFAPTETMHTAIRWFAEYQPMTPIINAVRALMLGHPPGNDLWIALAWTSATAILAFAFAVRRFKRKM